MANKFGLELEHVGYEHETCFPRGMHLNPAVLRGPSLISRSIPRNSVLSARAGGSPEASAEIHAYISARDMALAEAERDVSTLTLNRAFLANQMVEGCLKPARSPYQAQCLPENEAIRERYRCEAAKARLTKLRQAVVAGHFDCAAAA